MAYFRIINEAEKKAIERGQGSAPSRSQGPLSSGRTIVLGPGQSRVKGRVQIK